jgi:hypothetical protein
LEREALLGNEALADDAPMLRIRRWPQLLSVAAVILLTIGLGAIVYSVLPAGSPALSVAPQLPLSVLDGLPAGRERGDGNLASQAPPAGRNQPDLAIANQLAGPLTPSQLRDRDQSPVLVHGAIGTVDADGLTSGADGRTLVIKVRAEDVKLANDEVVRFLSANNIVWSEAEAQVLVQLPYEAGLAMSMPGAAGMGGQIALQRGNEAVASKAAEESTRRTAINPVDQGIAEVASNERKDREPQTPSNPENRPLRAAGAISPAAVADASLNAPINRLVRQISLAGGASAAGASRVILARNLNGRQVTELTTTLSRSQRMGGDEVANRGVVLQVANTSREDLYDLEQLLQRQRAGRSEASPATPTTQPVETISYAKPAPAAPTTRPVAPALQETAALPATRPAEGTYTCVIVLEGATSPDHPTTAPSTQPVSEPFVTPPATQPVR